MKLAQALEEARQKLAQAKVPSPDADAHWLLAHAISSNRAEVLRRITLLEDLSQTEQDLFYSSLNRRVKREPLAIAISLALETSAEVVAIEVSNDAAKYARENIQRFAPHVQLIVGSFEQSLLNLTELDLIISNPPYIPRAAVPIEPEVYKFDPEVALYSGEDGLDSIREIVAISTFALRPEGMLVLEHADGQSDQVCELLLEQGFTSVTAHPDPTGRLRAVSGIRRA